MLVLIVLLAIHLEVIFEMMIESDLELALKLTPTGITNRDEYVFKVARERNIPIIMLLSGGYQMNNASVIADSITNLIKKCNLFEKL